MRCLRFIPRMIVATIVVSAVMVATQDIQIFPGALLSLSSGTARDPAELPIGVESIFVDTEDSERIELWRLGVEKSDRVALIFHGNGADMLSFFAYQQFFQLLWVTSYGFDYRGYGRSSGWPSEEGLYADGRAAARYALKREGIPSDKLVIVGVSIGVGPATQIARELGVKDLILFSPYRSVPDVIRTIPLLGLLAPFSFYDFDVIEDVRQLSLSCFVVAHGGQDETIPVEQGREVFASYTGGEGRHYIEPPQARHNDILFAAVEPLQRALLRCWNGTS